jgi:hypothetical protein
MMHAKRIGEYLELDDGTSRLVPQVALLLNIRQRLSEELPDTLWRSCAIANYKQGVVVIFAGNNAAAAKLRLWAPKITEILGALGYQVTNIKVEVQAMGMATAQPAVKKALSLSPRATTALARSSSRLPEGRLKRAVAALVVKKS